MTSINDVCVSPDDDLHAVLKCINATGRQIALVIDEEGRLAGTITDGDVRRALIGGLDLSSRADAVMNRNPLTARVGTPHDLLESRIRSAGLLGIPLLDGHGRVVELYILRDHRLPVALPNQVVIMAGGMGTRLQHLTTNCPKPMLDVAGKPLLEHIVVALAGQGFQRIMLSVNYMAEVIERHFQDGAEFGVQIEYIRETERLGTAGALSLLRSRPSHPLLVVNGDVLTKLHHATLLQSHIASGAVATMAVREHQVEVPYGVVELEGRRIAKLREKPTYNLYVNAGAYVLQPEVLSRVPSNTFYDMPRLFEQLMLEDLQTHAYPLEGYWLDIGQIADYEQARGDYSREFL
jgi:dTDP-glucose pyrophosphorylase/CBS domain-containing protein